MAVRQYNTRIGILPRCPTRRSSKSSSNYYTVLFTWSPPKLTSPRNTLIVVQSYHYPTSDKISAFDTTNLKKFLWMFWGDTRHEWAGFVQLRLWAFPSHYSFQLMYLNDIWHQANYYRSRQPLSYLGILNDQAQSLYDISTPSSRDRKSVV